MAPTVDTPTFTATLSAIDQLKLTNQTTAAASSYPRPALQLSGALAHLPYTDVTPILGREFTTVQIRDLLTAPNSDALLRDLAITISQRNVVFFRRQHELTTDELKRFVQRLGELTGKPKDSGLHIHPIVNPGREDYGTDDKEISKISSKLNNTIYRRVGLRSTVDDRRQSSTRLWHR